MKVKILSIISLFAILQSAPTMAKVDDVKLSRQAAAALKGDVCAEAAVASVRDYIAELNYQAGTDIPDGGYPIPYIEQVLKYEKGIYSVLVTNYQLPTLNVKTRKTARGCKAGEPYTDNFGPE